jgi:hypothetical protein
MNTEIADWMTAETFHPRLTITSGATEAVVEALRHELEAEHFTVQEATSEHTRLRHHDWLAIASGMWARTEVVISPSDDSVLVEVTRGAEHRSARNKGHRALNAAVASLRARGTHLAVGEWHKAP